MPNKKRYLFHLDRHNCCNTMSIACERDSVLNFVLFILALQIGLTIISMLGPFVIPELFLFVKLYYLIIFYVLGIFSLIYQAILFIALLNFKYYGREMILIALWSLLLTQIFLPAQGYLDLTSVIIIPIVIFLLKYFNKTNIKNKFILCELTKQKEKAF